MKRLTLTLMLLGASCAGIALPERASAVATTKVALTFSAWVDLGVGPLQLNSGGTQVLYAIADTTPPLPALGFALPTDSNQVVNTATHVWAIAATPNVASVIVAPVAGTSGSGGTFTWPGSAAVTSYGTAPTGTVPAVNTFCTNCAGGGGASTWTPDYIYSTPLSVTSTSSVTPLPVTTVGAVLKIYNRGPSQAYYTLGTSGAAATTAMAQIAPQSWDVVTVKAGQTHLAAITNISTQTATLNIESGTGAPNGTGGPVNPSIYTSGQAATFMSAVAGFDNTAHALAVPVTLPGTASTIGAVAIQGCPSCTPVPVSGSFGVSIGGFTPSATGARMTPLSVALTDSTASLPTGAAVVVSNTDLTNQIYCNVNGVAATISDQKIPPNSWFQFTIPIGQTALHCIATGGTVIANGLGGSGLATGAAGGGGGGGGGGNVFQATLFTQGTASSAATIQVFALSGTTIIYLVNYSYQTDAAATGNGTFQIVTGTGTNCSTIHQTLTPAWNFAQNAGIAEGSIGTLGASSAGDAMCVVTTASQKVNWRIGVVQQ